MLDLFAHARTLGTERGVWRGVRPGRAAVHLLPRRGRDRRGRAGRATRPGERVVGSAASARSTAHQASAPWPASQAAKPSTAAGRADEVVGRAPHQVGPELDVVPGVVRGGAGPRRRRARPRSEPTAQQQPGRLVVVGRACGRGRAAGPWRRTQCRRRPAAAPERAPRPRGRPAPASGSSGPRPARRASRASPGPRPRPGRANGCELTSYGTPRAGRRAARPQQREPAPAVGAQHVDHLDPGLAEARGPAAGPPASAGTASSV